jgi:hypothetical protein
MASAFAPQLADATQRDLSALMQLWGAPSGLGLTAEGGSEPDGTLLLAGAGDGADAAAAGEWLLDFVEGVSGEGAPKAAVPPLRAQPTRCLDASHVAASCARYGRRPAARTASRARARRWAAPPRAPGRFMPACAACTRRPGALPARAVR